jgi:Peptidase A4 family
MRKYLAIAAGAAAMAAMAVLPTTAASAATTVSPVRTSDLWNGYVLDAPKSPGYIDLAQASWTVPKVKMTKGENGPAEASWVGLGGVSGDWSPLVQIGTISQARNVKGKEVQGDSPVWEVIQLPLVKSLPFSSPHLGTQPMNPGDHMTAEVGFNPFANGGTYEMYLHDSTRGWTWSVGYVTTLDRTYPRTGEWIVENPQFTPGEAMVNFGTFSFTGMAVELNGTEYGTPTDAMVFRLYTLPRVVNVSPLANGTGKIQYIG